MEKINAELGKVVCDELAFNDAVATMITDITTVSSRAIKVLREHFKDEVTDDEATLCTFADTAKFEDFISTSRDSYLGNIKFVPFEEKDRVCRLYQELHDTCISFVKDLSNGVRSSPKAFATAAATAEDGAGTATASNGFAPTGTWVSGPVPVSGVPSVQPASP
jgi:hypothetical protein